MNLLPDMIIIDFCEWLNNVLSVRHDDLDFYDLMLDEKNHHVLEEYADEYLHFQRYRSTIKKLLHRFIDSEEFDQCLDENRQSFRFWRFHVEELHYFFTVYTLINFLNISFRKHMVFIGNGSN